VTFWRDNRLIVHRIINKIRKEQSLYFVERADRYPLYTLISAEEILGKAVKVKKGKHTYSIDTFQWKLLHRFVGLSLYCSVVIRMGREKLSFFPESLKKYIKKSHKIVKQALNKALEIVLKFNREK
jgi:hypothetical protein